MKVSGAGETAQSITCLLSGSGMGLIPRTDIFKKSVLGTAERDQHYRADPALPENTSSVLSIKLDVLEQAACNPSSRDLTSSSALIFLCAPPPHSGKIIKISLCFLIARHHAVGL